MAKKHGAAGDELFAAIPVSALHRSDLGATDFRALGIVAKYDRRSLVVGKGAGCFKSLNRLADELSMDRRQFRRSIEKLVELGFIQRTPRGERWQGYVLQVDYGGEGSGDLTLRTQEPSPPKDSSVPTVRFEESLGCGLQCPHIREPVREHVTEPLFCQAEQVSFGDQIDPVQKIIDQWRDVAVPAGGKAIRKVSPLRRKAIKAAIKSEGLDDVCQAIERISTAKWAMGKTDRARAVGLDWLLKPGKVNAILEGQYDDFGWKPVSSTAYLSAMNRQDHRDGFTRAIDRRLYAGDA